MVRGGRLRGACLVEAFSEGMDGDSASLAELGLSQAATAEIVEEGVPAEVEDVAPRHGVNSRTGPRPHHGNDRRFSRRLPDALHRTDSVRTLKTKAGEDRTPAMMAKLTDHGWTLVEWLKRPAVQLA